MILAYYSSGLNCSDRHGGLTASLTMKHGGLRPLSVQNVPVEEALLVRATTTPSPAVLVICGQEIVTDMWSELFSKLACTEAVVASITLYFTERNIYCGDNVKE